MNLPLSYTQNMEDYQAGLPFAGQSTGFYIDVGAGHPVADNVTFWFYERGWRGVVVEPQRKLADLYRHIRPRDTAVCALLGREEGEADLHVFDRLHGLSTTVHRHAESANEHEPHRIVRLPVSTLAALCRDCAPDTIDLLKIDVEGAEGDVLRGNDWRRFRPKMLVIEAIAPLSNEPAWEDWEAFVLAQDYEFCLFDTLNRYYVAKEQTALLARMPRERAPWDAVRHMYEIGRAPENALHPDHELARELVTGFLAALPATDAATLAKFLARARGRESDANQLALLAAELVSDTGRAALGRIACGYDGGQIHPD